MKSSTILSLVGVAAVMLVIGTALGSIAFPMTKTETTTTTQRQWDTASNQPVTLKQTVTSYTTILPSANSTITERIDVKYVFHVKAYASGTCSWVAGTGMIEISSNSTEYLFPNVNVTGSVRFLNFSVTTTTVTLTGSQSTLTDTTITLTQSNSSSVGCPTVV